MNQERHGTESGRATKQKRSSWPIVIMGTVSAVLVGGIAIQLIRPQAGQAVDRETAKKMVEETKAKQAGAKGSKTLARVGNDAIYWDELAEECIVRHGTEVLDNLINRKIIEQAAGQKNVQVSNEEVAQEINRVAAKFGMSVEQWYQYLKSERDTSAANYQRDVIWPMLALKKLAGTEVKIDDKDVQEAFVREYGERVRAKAIVMDNPRRAADVWNKVNANPDDFEMYVREHSVDPTSRALGGAIPPIQRFSGNPSSKELEERAFKMKEGEISPVIQVETQYIILRCEGRTEPVVTSLDEVKEQLVDDLRERKTQELVAGLFTQLKEEIRVDNYLTNRSEGKAPEAAPGPVRQTKGGAAEAGEKVVPASGSKVRKSAAKEE
jgi:foldase protein PrsA